MYSVKHWLPVFSLVLAVTEVVSQEACSNVGVTSTVSISFSTLTGEIPANLGNPIDLRCDVQLSSTSGNVPSISSYIWEQNGIVLQAANSNNYRLPSVESSDGGEYRCAAITDTNCITLFSSTRVVTTGPTFTGIVSEPQNVVEMDRLTLTCEASGWPIPTITWFKVGSNDTLMNVATGRQLIINSTSLSDAGMYECQASNHRGDVEGRIQIDIEPAPTNPTTEEETEEPTTQAPVDSTQRSEAEVVKPTATPKVEFYIAVAVTFAVCFIIALLVVIMAIVGVCVAYKQENYKGDEVAPEYGDEEELVEMETLETEMPKPKKKKNRARRKF